MALEVNIEKTTGDFHLRVTFSCESGITGILGPSGCGKSMTLKCIAGIERPDRGRILLNGRVLYDADQGINLPPQKRRVGYLFQNYALFPNMTVRQNILCGLHAEKDKERRRVEADRVTKLLQLGEVSGLRPAQLSGGQAQRAALARILVSRPELLLLDEPFSALDTHLRLKLQMQLRELLAGYGKGVLMVTHDRDEAYRMCAEIGIMEKGSMESVRETRMVFADPQTEAAAVLTGCKNIVPADKRGEREVYVPDWGICFKTAKPVRDGLKAIGIRAHYFNSKTTVNAYPVEILREMEEPFEWIMEFRYEGQRKESPPIWWRYPKDKRLQEPPRVLGIAPANILLLY